MSSRRFGHAAMRYRIPGVLQLLEKVHVAWIMVIPRVGRTPSESVAQMGQRRNLRLEQRLGRCVRRSKHGVDACAMINLAECSVCLDLDRKEEE
jgi:hypothetical protein